MTIPDIRELVHMASAVFKADDSCDSEIILDAVITALFSDAEKAVIKLLHQYGPTPAPGGLDAEACAALEDQFHLVTSVVLANGVAGLALNSIGEPYGRLLAAQK